MVVIIAAIVIFLTCTTLTLRKHRANVFTIIITITPLSLLLVRLYAFMLIAAAFCCNETLGDSISSSRRDSQENCHGEVNHLDKFEIEPRKSVE
jgi:hypothetical protein